MPMRRVYTLLLFLAVMTCGGCVDLGGAQTMALPAPEPTPIYDHLITPNRVGPISLGMPGDQMLSMMGSPSQSMDSGGATTATWDDAKMSISIRDDNHLVCSIMVSSADYLIGGTVGVGSTQLEMRVKLGNPSFLNNYAGGWRADYNNYGYAIYGGTDGVINTIYVGYGEYCR